MEGLSERNNLITIIALHLLVIATSQLDCRFISFRATVAEENNVRTANFCQQPSRFFLLRSVKKVRYMP
ncbi:hypothetical protein D3C80_1356720 [compost metagenome]